MEDITVDKFKKLFLEYICKFDYKVIKPDSLLSESFPTTFTISGGPNFANKYLEDYSSEGRNEVVLQRCIRHWDYSNVGDGKHLSFFEMAVTNCFEGYKRNKMFEHHVNFLIDVLDVDMDCLWVTIYKGGECKGSFFPPDLEAKKIWLDLGIPQKRIVELGSEYNFVANSVEPIGGPRTEIFFDKKIEGKCKGECLPGLCSCGRFIEFWTSVNYNQHVKAIFGEERKSENAKYIFKPTRKILPAAGFGIERTVMIVNNMPKISYVNTINPCIEFICDYIKVYNKNKENSLKKDICIIADHIRGLVFLVLDGILELSGKESKSRKYEYRKYLKNMFNSLIRLRLFNNKKFIEKIISLVIDIYRPFYPDIQSIKSKAETAMFKRMERYDLNSREWK